MGDRIIQMVDDNHDEEVDNGIVPHDQRGPHNAHNGKNISSIILSPNGTYAITYSRSDHSFEGWIVEDSKLTLDPVNTYKINGRAYEIAVNDSKVVYYTYLYGVNCFQMSNEHQGIKLQCTLRYSRICLEKNGNLVIFGASEILVYSPHDKMNELNLISSHKLSSCTKGVFVENSNIWAISPNYLFHWDLKTFEFKFSYSLGFTIFTGEKFTVKSKGNLIGINYFEKVVIFPKDVHFPIRSIQSYSTESQIEFCEVQNHTYLLIFNLPSPYITDEKQYINLYSITDTNKQPIDASSIFNDKDSAKDEFILHKYNSDSKEALGLVNRKFPCIKNVDINWQKFIESHKEFFETYEESDDFVGWNDYLCGALEKKYYNDVLTFPDMENIKSLVSGRENIENIPDINFNNQKYKWRISRENAKISVYTDEVFQCSKKLNIDPLNWKILNNNALALRNASFIVIYKYDINKNSINSPYSLYNSQGFNIKDFSGPLLPTMSDLEIIKNIIKDDRCLVKYGPTLLPILIKSADPDLTSNIEVIYNKCTKFVKEDLKSNLKFLNIITLSIYDLYEKYSDYVTKFNSEMFMILDPWNESINDSEDYLHLSIFSQEIDISKMSKYSKFLQYLFSLYSLVSNAFRHLTGRSKAIQYITLIVPYVGYSCYPLEYSWWREIFYPQSSIFVKTSKKEFYTNWNGEAIINYKWRTFGRVYYFITWLLFMVFLVCFTIASYPTNSITKAIRIKLYQTSIAFGFSHLIFELRQFIWNPKEYFLSVWNFFDLSAYFSATIVSIYWIKYDDIPDWALSLSCLLLDLKFLFFFKIFEYFGIYFAIIFGVARRVFSFLVVLAIIILSFAHAFFLLLHPQNLLNSLDSQNSNDPNNPWTLSNTYNQVDDNGNVLNETLIQVPSENTNLFYSYPTSLLATYLFLTGNQNSLSPWAPKPTAEVTLLFILMALFSFLIVIYLMNLFIGLLSNAIEEDNDRASYLAQKAEVIAEIELFCLLPHQRRWKTWFPEVIYYRVDVEKARIYIREAIRKGEWKMNDWPEMKLKILKLLSIDDVIIDQVV